MQFTLDCMINRQWQRMFSLQSGVRDSVYVCVLVTMRQRPLGWNNVWLGVCACVGVSPWFINVGFSTTWAHSSSSTHCNATGTHTCCPAQGQWGEAVGRLASNIYYDHSWHKKHTDWLVTDTFGLAHITDDIGWSKNFKTIKIPAIYALICFDLSGGKGVSCSRKTSSGTNTNAFLIHNLLASSRKNCQLSYSELQRTRFSRYF